jgi:hypothetical protein
MLDLEKGLLEDIQQFLLNDGKGSVAGSVRRKARCARRP